ncbi:MAG: DUF4265 domain-containing protein [Polyangiaceae bacterium]
MIRKKLTFRLERDEDGYPPVDYERVWIETIDEGSGIIDNIPFFCRDVSLGDTVKFQLIGNEIWYVATIRRSGNSLIRVLYYDTDPSSIRNLIEDLGCETELDTTHKLLAVSVPPGELSQVQAFLAAKEAEGVLGYEEAILVDVAPSEG